MGNWDSGKVSTLRMGERLSCNALGPQFYAVVLYNSKQHATEATVTVVAGGESADVKVPGATANEGLASVCLISGRKTNSVSLSIAPGAAMPEIQAWLVSLAMPTDIQGITNERLTADGKEHAFGKYRRYYGVLASSLHRLTLRTVGGRQFMAIEMEEDHAKIFVLNPSSKVDSRIVCIGVPATSYEVKKAEGIRQELSMTFQSDGSHRVWMNLENEQNSQDVKLSIDEIDR